MGGAGVSVGTGAAAGVEHQLYMAHKQAGQGGFNITGVGQKFQLFVRDFDHIGQRQELQHRAAQSITVRPQRKAQVGVKVNDSPGAAGCGNGSFVGFPHGAFHQGNAAKMQGIGVGKQAGIHLLRGVQQIG